jgi:hypothetical protein
MVKSLLRRFGLFVLIDSELGSDEREKKSSRKMLAQVSFGENVLRKLGCSQLCCDDHCTFRFAQADCHMRSYGIALFQPHEPS